MRVYFNVEISIDRSKKGQRNTFTSESEQYIKHNV